MQCPKCKRINTDPVVDYRLLTDTKGNSVQAILFLCSLLTCRTPLSVQVNPFSVKDEILDELKPLKPTR